MPTKKKTPATPAEEVIVPPAPVEPIVPVTPEPVVVPTPGAASDKPGMVTAIAVMTLISGISNIIWMLIVGANIGIAGIASLGIGCLFLPIVIPPIVLGIFEIVYAAKLLSTPIKPTRPSQAIAIMEIICVLTGNIIPVVAGILALVFYGDEKVKAYFARYGQV